MCMFVCTCSHSLGANNYHQGKGARGGFKQGAHNQICKVGGLPSAQVKGKWVGTGVRQEAIRVQHRLLTAAVTEKGEKGKALCAPQHFGCLLEVSVVGRMMVVGNRESK